MLFHLKAGYLKWKDTKEISAKDNYFWLRTSFESDVDEKVERTLKIILSYERHIFKNMS